MRLTCKFAYPVQEKEEFRVLEGAPIEGVYQMRHAFQKHSQIHRSNYAGLGGSSPYEIRHFYFVIKSCSQKL